MRTVGIFTELLINYIRTLNKIQTAIAEDENLPTLSQKVSYELNKFYLFKTNNETNNISFKITYVYI